MKGIRPSDRAGNPQRVYRLLPIKCSRPPAQQRVIGPANDFAYTARRQRKGNAPASPTELDLFPPHIQNLGVLMHVEKKIDIMPAAAFELIGYVYRRGPGIKAQGAAMHYRILQSLVAVVLGRHT